MGRHFFLIFLFFFLLRIDGISAITLMSYNVENLFDTIDDELKEDETFLPLTSRAKKSCEKIKNLYYQRECRTTDWTSQKLDKKLENIKEVISSYPREIDFLALIEVENDRVLEKLSHKFKGKYKFVATHSPDRRGIDVALFYRRDKKLRFISSEEFEVKDVANKPTRNILITHFKLKGRRDLFIFVNHWPSQNAPSKVRLAIGELLAKKVEKIRRQFPEASMIITGDFNTLDGEFPSPFSSLIRDLHFVDTRSFFPKEALQGSYFYPPQMSWNLLDRFFISKNISSSKGVKSEVWAPDFIQDVYEYTSKKSVYYGSRIIGIPKSFKHKGRNLKKMGYSDHFPIVLNFYL